MSDFWASFAYWKALGKGSLVAKIFFYWMRDSGGTPGLDCARLSRGSNKILHVLILFPPDNQYWPVVLSLITGELGISILIDIGPSLMTARFFDHLEQHVQLKSKQIQGEKKIYKWEFKWHSETPRNLLFKSFLKRLKNYCISKQFFKNSCR